MGFRCSATAAPTAAPIDANASSGIVHTFSICPFSFADTLQVCKMHTHVQSVGGMTAKGTEWLHL